MQSSANYCILKFSCRFFWYVIHFFNGILPAEKYFLKKKHENRQVLHAWVNPSHLLGRLLPPTHPRTKKQQIRNVHQEKCRLFENEKCGRFLVANFLSIFPGRTRLNTYHLKLHHIHCNKIYLSPGAHSGSIFAFWRRNVDQVPNQRTWAHGHS